MESKKSDISLLGQLFVVLLVIANVLSSKTIQISLFLVPGGIICYGFTFLMIDVIGERYGQQESKKVVEFGFVIQIICAILIQIVVLLPGKESSNFDSAMVGNWWFSIAGLTAYLVSQTIGIKIFHTLRSKLIQKKKEWKWLWENLSTILGQMIDSFIFVGVAYGIGLQANFETIKIMIISQIVVKTILALIDTPIFYYLTRRKRQCHTDQM